jgi:membrane protein involved in D-alanine export
MYAYSLYLFFDFAGYSAFAIGFSYLFGIRTPENFNLPFLATNIRDFWNRWHITLSFWFRDHVYMRFLIAAAKSKWFRSEQIASYLGYFLAFGLMGLWHGTELHYIIYGLYQACLLTLYDLFSRWNKQRQLWRTGRAWRLASIVVTFHFVCFGFFIFSGRLGNLTFHGG